jgi:hypothetical protein
MGLRVDVRDERAGMGRVVHGHLMMVLIVKDVGVPILELERQSLCAIDRDSPTTVHLAFQWMKREAWQVHFVNGLRGIQEPVGLCWSRRELGCAKTATADVPVHSASIEQASAEIWTAQADSPTGQPKFDKLLGQPAVCVASWRGLSEHQPCCRSRRVCASSDDRMLRVTQHTDAQPPACHD